MVDPNFLQPDFRATENTEYGTRSLILTHDEPATYLQLAGHVPTHSVPYYTYRWQTPLEAEAALEVLDGAERLNGLNPRHGELIVRNTSLTGGYICDWVPLSKLQAGETPLPLSSVFEIPVGSLELELETEVILGWERLARSPVRQFMKAETIDREPSWLKDFYAMTVDAPTNEVLARNIGAINTALTTFIEEVR